MVELVQIERERESERERERERERMQRKRTGENAGKENGEREMCLSEREFA